VQRSTVETSLLLIVLSLGWVSIAAATPPASSTTALIAQVSDTVLYDRYMRQGYRATTQRDYNNAILHFRDALRQRPRDRYATQAVRNVSRYISNNKGNRDIVIILPGSGPSDRASAGRRTATCGGCLAALVPELPTADQFNLLATTVNYPDLFFYVKPIPAKSIEFELEDEANSKTYTIKFPPASTNKFLRINLANLKDRDGKPLPPLVVDQTYPWRLRIITATDGSASPFIESTITRRSLDPNLADTLQQSTPIERISLYASLDLWYDLVATLYQVQQQNPKNPELKRQWTELLGSIDLTPLAQLPLKN
jgi:hypothetical protein